MLLYEIHDVFEASGISYAIVGGYALALHGIVRATIDVDLVLNLTLESFVSAEKALNTLGLTSRLPLHAAEVFQFRKEYIEKRNLLAWSFVDFNNPTRQVDILINKSRGSFKSEKISVGGKKISVITLKDLLKMKKESGREKDLIDIQLIEAHLAKNKSKI
jgi:hypothetical protein